MASEVKRLRYFTGQLLRQLDFVAEQDYHIQQMREHQRWLHTPGIAAGFVVKAGTSATSVLIEAGTAYDDLGQRIVRAGNVELDLTNTLDSANNEAPEVYITVAWAEQEGKESGDEGNTRYIEEARIDKSASPPTNSRRELVLAKVKRNGTNVTTIETAERLRSGVAVGDMEVPSVTLSRSDIARTDWTKLSLTAARQAQLAGNLDVTQNVTANGRNITNELDALKTHTANTANPHQTTAAQVDGTTNQIVTRINAGTGVINAARVQFLNEKLNGESMFGQVTLVPASGLPGGATGAQTIVIANRDLRNKLITVRGWIGSPAGGTPSFPSALQAMAWNPAQPMPPTPTPGEGAGRESWAWFRPAAPSGTLATLFQLIDPTGIPGGIPITAEIQYLVTAQAPQGQLNLRLSGPSSHTVGYVFQFTWQD